MLLSHPNKKLLAHLNETHQNMLMFLSEKSIGLSNEDNSKIIKILAFCHDFGKCNPFFQEYIRGGKVKDEEKEHSLISALFASFVALNILDRKELSILVFSVIVSHHGNIKDLTDILRRGQVKELEKIAFYQRNIERNKDKTIEVYKELDYSQFIEEFLSLNIENLINELRVIHSSNVKRAKIKDFYFLHHYYYSLLIDSDKLSASSTIIPNINTITYKEFLKEKERKFGLDTDNYRNVIYNTVIQNLELNTNEDFLTITSPTGSGKTITGIGAALYLKEKCNLKKIFYIMPFTSIINQSYEVLREFHKDKDSTYLFSYHSLSNNNYVVNDKGLILESGEYITPNIKNIGLIESLHSGITVTTFNQLFEAVISSKNRMIKKLHSFNNSVILIDEIQAISVKYMVGIQFILEKLVEYFNVKIIIMTATKPFILKDKTKELLPNYKDFFNLSRRTQFNFINSLKPVTIEEFVGIFNHQYISDKSYMIVCNSIASSMQVFKAIRKLKLVSEEDLYYLSTNQIPKDRMDIIFEIKEKLKKNKKVILICTQLVEAGVDVDFDEVFRDLSPIPSIVQVAGRCNRNGKKKRGNVSLFMLAADSEKEKMVYSYIYDKVEILITKEVLNKYSHGYTVKIKEEDYIYMIDEYYERLMDKYKDSQQSKDLTKAIAQFDLSNDSFIRKFALIDEKIGYIDLFLPVGEEGVATLNRFLNILKIEDKFNKKDSLVEIRGDLQKFKISLPLKAIKSKISYIKEVGGFLYLDVTATEQFYCKKLGFLRDDFEGGEGLFI